MPKILIADDSLFQRVIISKLVKELGFETLEAANGQECIDLGLSQAPDLVILDLNMPVKSGLEALEAFQTAGRTLPTLVVTADIQSSTKALCEERGAACVLNKPVDNDTFRRTILQLLGAA